MIALFTQPPQFCPKCGERITWGPLDRNDWNANCSYTHKCGLNFQHITDKDALDAAKASGGDLPQYIND